jgi:hypothetical protein
MNNMSFFAPMIGHISFGVFYYANPQCGVLERLPPGCSGFSGVFGFWYGCPVNGLKWYLAHSVEMCANVKTVA